MPKDMEAAKRIEHIEATSDRLELLDKEVNNTSNHESCVAM